MKIARYRKWIGVRIEDEPEPSLPEGGLIVRTEACGLGCDELIDWHMESKGAHVLGHEAAGKVEQSDDARFPVGVRVFPHHHASCGDCEACLKDNEVHCEQWKNTQLLPGGMAEAFAVGPQSLSDCWVVDDLRSIDAALVEPLACVDKSIVRANVDEGSRIAVVGVDSLGLMHALVLNAYGHEVDGIESEPGRREWADGLGIRAIEKAEGIYDRVFVPSGTVSALGEAMSMVGPGGVVIIGFPLSPGEAPIVDWSVLYSEEVSLIPSYSSGRSNTSEAVEMLREGTVKAEQVVSHFVTLDELPAAYDGMKSGDILKAMVVFDH